jgi:hypothetical protein
MVNAAVAALPARMNLRREKAADPLDADGADPALDALELVAGRDGDFAVWVLVGSVFMVDDILIGERRGGC